MIMIKKCFNILLVLVILLPIFSPLYDVGATYNQDSPFENTSKEFDDLEIADNIELEIPFEENDFLDVDETPETDEVDETPETDEIYEDNLLNENEDDLDNDLMNEAEIEDSMFEETSESTTSYTPLHPQASLYGVVTGNSASNPLRSGPGSSYPQIESLARGTQVTLLGLSSNSNWYRVVVGNTHGWIAVGRIDRVHLNMVTVGGATRNPLRRGPGQTYDEITTLNRNVQLIARGVSTNGNWILVDHGNETGWIHSNRVERINLNGITVGGATRNPFRHGPGEAHTEIRTVDRNVEVTILGNAGAWRLISHGNQIGWMHSNRLERIDLNVITGEFAGNPFRRGPGTRDGFDEFDNLGRNVQLTVLGTWGTWSLVSQGNTTGWMSTSRLTRVNLNGITVGGATRNPFRRGPGMDYDEFTALDRNVQISVLGVSGSWSLISQGNTTGWMHSNRLEPVSLNVMTGEFNNNPLRRGPGTRAGFDEFNSFGRNLDFTVLGTWGTWSLVSRGNQTGWMSTNRLTRMNLNVITGNYASNPFRRGPGTVHDEFANHGRNVEFTVLGVSGTWSLVNRGNQTGWMSTNRLTRRNINYFTDQVGNAGHPFRRGPGESYAEISRLQQGVSVSARAVSTNGNWSLVVTGSQTGWIHSNRLSTVQPIPSTPFIRPLAIGEIVSGFGYRWDGFHRGVDIVTPGNNNAQILAVANGTVHRIAFEGAGYGHYIILRHNINGTIYYTLYAHLRDRPSLSVGSSVSQGQQIGIKGNTGSTFGTCGGRSCGHLHFEIHRGSFTYGRTTALNPAVRLNLPNSWTTSRMLIDFPEYEYTHSYDSLNNDDVRGDNVIEYIDHPIVGSWQMVNYHEYDSEGNQGLDVLEWSIENGWATQGEIDLPITFYSNGTIETGESWWTSEGEVLVQHGDTVLNSSTYSIDGDTLTLTSRPEPDGSYSIRMFIRVR